jgi:predicted phosphoribosyltransferase
VIRRDELSEREDVFRDRAHAGEVLASMVSELLAARELADPVVLAVPAGGVPVAVEIAKRCALPLDVAVVSKITLPWNTEAGYGAIAFDGSVHLNQALIDAVSLTDAQIAEGIAKTKTRVERRMKRLRGRGGVPDVAGRAAFIVDDGLASGFTMRAAVSAVRGAGASEVIVAVPTGHVDAVKKMDALADEVLCANVRSNTPFAVANAYERWHDVPEVLADEALRPFRDRDGPWAEP